MTPENPGVKEEMNGLSDALTIGLVLALVFGALFFYLYSRLGQAEKRISLTENILLDLKIATENTIMSMAAPPGGSPEVVEEQRLNETALIHEEPVVAEEELATNDEDFYKQVLQQTESTVANVDTDEPSIFRKQSSSVKMDVNYESMTLKELKALAKQRGISIANAAHKKDVIDALKRQEDENVMGPLEGSFGNKGLISADEGFPVDLGSSSATDSRNAE